MGLIKQYIVGRDWINANAKLLMTKEQYNIAVEICNHYWPKWEQNDFTDLKSQAGTDTVFNTMAKQFYTKLTGNTWLLQSQCGCANDYRKLCEELYIYINIYNNNEKILIEK